MNNKDEHRLERMHKIRWKIKAKLNQVEAEYMKYNFKRNAALSKFEAKHVKIFGPVSGKSYLVKGWSEGISLLEISSELASLMAVGCVIQSFINLKSHHAHSLSYL